MRSVHVVTHAAEELEESMVQEEEEEDPGRTLGPWRTLRTLEH
jgi:hypothetical protein